LLQHYVLNKVKKPGLSEDDAAALILPSLVVDQQTKARDR